MHFILRDQISIAGYQVNEDRVGMAGPLAWVIDGATDVLEERILPGLSDAGWFADELHQALTRASVYDITDLYTVIPKATSEIRLRFEQQILRPVEHSHEYPSAAGVLTHLSGNTLTYLSLADCSLIRLPGRLGTEDMIDGNDDRESDSVVNEAASRLSRTKHKHEKIHADLMPLLQASRKRMNHEDGYGIFSVSLPPQKFIKSGTVDVQSGDQFLLASDGFLRLVDVFLTFNMEQLGEEVVSGGLMPLMLKLRELEYGDEDCMVYPRAKAFDDASAMIVEVVGD